MYLWYIFLDDVDYLVDDIIGGSAGSGTRGADQGRPTGNLGTEGAGG
jgi:hypothetical protein